MLDRLCQSNKQEERGQSFLEMAIALPVLLVLLMGLIEVVPLMRAQLVLTNATREGARLASRGVGVDEVFDRTMTAFSHQLPADPNTNTGIIVTQFHVPAPSEHLPFVVTTTVTGTLVYNTDVSTRTCASTIPPNYGQTLTSANAAYSTTHDVAIVEACHYYDLNILPVTWVLYDRTTMRVAARRAR